MGTVLVSSICHYCGGKATTEDHIVPRMLLPKPMCVLPGWFRSNNVVPACFDCNGRKSHWRSDCECSSCSWAWGVARKQGFVPEGFDYRRHKVIVLVRDSLELVG